MNLNEAISYLEQNGYKIDHDTMLDEGFKDWIKSIKEKASSFTKKKLESALAKALSKEGFKSLETVLAKLKKAFPDKADSVDQLAAKLKEAINASKKESNDKEIDENEPVLSANESWAIKYDMPMLNETWDWESDLTPSKDHDHGALFMVCAHIILGWLVNFVEAFTGKDQYYGGNLKLDWLERIFAFFAGMRDLGILIGVLMAGISVLLVLSGVPAKELMHVYAERISDVINLLKNII